MTYYHLRNSLSSIFISICGIILFFHTASAQEDEKDAPYVPSPDTVVEKMLDMANVGSGDYLIDLGSGDGRIPIMAAKRGAYAHGIEIDSSLVRKARKNARKAGVGNRVAFIQGDLFKHDVSRASVVTMYLFPEILRKLRPHLLKALDPGTRIVSHLFLIGKWNPDRHAVIRPDIYALQSNQLIADPMLGLQDFLSLNENAPSHMFPEHDIYMWIVPADAGGQWKWITSGDTVTARIDQQYQEIDLTISVRDTSFQASDATLKGRRISFMYDQNGVHYSYSGKIKKDTIKGVVQVHEGQKAVIKQWDAKLISDSSSIRLEQE